MCPTGSRLGLMVEAVAVFAGALSGCSSTPSTSTTSSSTTSTTTTTASAGQAVAPFQIRLM